MGPLELLLVLVVGALWIVPSYYVARYAERKGQSFAAFFVFSLLISWVISWIIASVVEDKSQHRPAVAAAPSENYLDQLKKLGELRDSGALSAEEFDSEKARLLTARR